MTGASQWPPPPLGMQPDPVPAPTPMPWAQRQPVLAGLVLFASLGVPPLFVGLIVAFVRRTTGRSRNIVLGIGLSGVLLAAIGVSVMSVFPSLDSNRRQWYAIGYEAGHRVLGARSNDGGADVCNSFADYLERKTGYKFESDRAAWMDGCRDGFLNKPSQYPDEPLPSVTAGTDSGTQL